jgi:hypothetical protein
VQGAPRLLCFAGPCCRTFPQHIDSLDGRNLAYPSETCCPRIHRQAISAKLRKERGLEPAPSAKFNSIRKPPLDRQGFAHGRMNLRPSCPETGLGKILADCMLMRRQPRYVYSEDENADVVKCAQDACAAVRPSTRSAGRAVTTSVWPPSRRDGAGGDAHTSHLGKPNHLMIRAAAESDSRRTEPLRPCGVTPAWP